MFSTNFVSNISHSKNEMNTTPCMYIGLDVKDPSFFSDFNQTWFFSTYFLIILKHQNLMKILPVGAEPFHAEWRTDTTKLVDTFHNIANAPINVYSSQPETQMSIQVNQKQSSHYKTPQLVTNIVSRNIRIQKCNKITQNNDSKKNPEFKRR
jgi:hypothetical protein